MERPGPEPKPESSHDPGPGAGSPRSAISKLPDNILSDIFTFYGENVFSEPGGHRFWWHTLALVCQKWNAVIGFSRSHFPDELRFGGGSTTRFLMDISNQALGAHLTPDPTCAALHLAIDHRDSGSVGPADQLHKYRTHQLGHREQDHGARAPEHVSRGQLAAPARIQNDRGVPSVSAISPAFAHPPTTFVLDGIPDSSHLPPEALLAYLGLMPQLQYLNIGFLSSVPNPRSGGRGPAFGLLDRVKPSLPYWTPHTSARSFILFHQLRYPIPRLSAFLRRTKRYGFDGIWIHFDTQGATISAIPALSPSTGETLFIGIPCNHLDFQVASVAQVCRALRPNFANMEDLFLKYHQNQLPAEWHGEVEPALWSELLAQFLGMKTLWLSSALVSEVTQAIRSSARQLLEEMPILVWIIVEVQEDDASVAAVQSLSDLLIEIRRSGGPVIELYRLFPDMWNRHMLPPG
ncbi:hypothetical protein BJV78DRAFT_1281304 [Lactifluus subvellereus]|nr:hypothetical protein BJV78DRAFT_1281304 [Lactifluus subvellereus]